ncbi:hypothetical protein [Streptosporangium sandarakinum]
MNRAARDRWKGPLLESAPMSTAKDDGFSVYEQGAGRADLLRRTEEATR